MSRLSKDRDNGEWLLRADRAERVELDIENRGERPVKSRAENDAKLAQLVREAVKWEDED